MNELIESPAWQLVRERHALSAEADLVSLYAADAERAARFTRSAAGITMDAGRTHLVPASLDALFELARQQDVFAWRDRMLAGEKINMTEGRAALHMALRLPELREVRVDGVAVGEVLADMDRRMGDLVEGVRNGDIRALDGDRFTDVVNVGIGGSDLGPRLVHEALSAGYEKDGLRAHFIANLDTVEREAVLRRIDPARTLFIIASKTFTTFETLRNAEALRSRVVDALGTHGVQAHFVAVTAVPERAAAFGVDPARIFPMPDWTGGRFSVWSAIGLPVALALGMPAFEALRAGAADMDRHFRDTPPEDNLPLWLALIGIWYGNFAGMRSRAVVPYAQQLARLPAYLQQLEMESGGKQIDRNGHPVVHATAPTVWGAVGTNAQHAFFQCLHQGSDVVPCDFIVPLRSGNSDHDAMFANCLAQASALATGQGSDELRRAGVTDRHRPHRVMPGNRPSVMLLLDDLAPRSLGALLALHEHKVFCQAMIWEINPFDQWGVERGKELARTLLSAVDGSAADGSALPDTGARELIARYRKKGAKQGF